MPKRYDYTTRKETGPCGEGSEFSGLFTDYYELTMAQAYHAEGLSGEAVFELAVRSLPGSRNFLLAAGITDVLDALENWRFSESDLDYLRGLGAFSDGFLDMLGALRFTGDVRAVPEGRGVFAGEPLLQVSAPIIQAQIVETLFLNQLHVQCLIASKAARMVMAAAGRDVVDFGSRRAHGYDAANKAARACYLAGAAGTSNVLAGKRYAIPVLGTMAHSYVQAHAGDLDAFESFLRLYPDTTLLVDTYDTLDGVRTVIDLARRLGDRFRVRAVRLDSGDIEALARASRELLDSAGLHSVRIFASSELDENKIADFVAGGVPIDGFGVGTRLVVSSDAPSLDVTYKLVEYQGQPRAKLSTGKLVYPCRKQIWRETRDGTLQGDVVRREDEPGLGEPLLVPMMVRGKRLPAGNTTLADARALAARELASLPAALRSLAPATPYPVRVSSTLHSELDTLRRTIAASRQPR